MKKFLKWFLIAGAAMLLLGMVFNFFESDEDKAVRDIEKTKLEQIEEAKSMKEINLIYRELDSVYRNHPSEKVQEALIQVHVKRAEIEKKLQAKIESEVKAFAYEAAKTQIKSMLKSPSTAEFVRYADTKMGIDENGIYHIYMQVDAQNSFGAMLRNNFDVSFLVLDGQIKILEVATL